MKKNIWYQLHCIGSDKYFEKSYILSLLWLFWAVYHLFLCMSFCHGWTLVFAVDSAFFSKKCCWLSILKERGKIHLVLLFGLSSFSVIAPVVILSRMSLRSILNTAKEFRPVQQVHVPTFWTFWQRIASNYMPLYAIMNHRGVNFCSVDKDLIRSMNEKHPIETFSYKWYCSKRSTSLTFQIIQLSKTSESVWPWL